MFLFYNTPVFYDTPMKKLTKFLAWLFGILIVLIIGLYIAASYTVRNFGPQLENILSEETGYHTEIKGSLSLKLLPGVSFIVNDLRVINNETYLVRVEKAEITVDGKKLFNSVFEITGLTLDKPQVFFDYDTTGMFNFDKPDNQRNGRTVKNGEKRHIALQHLTINDGKLIYFDYQHGDTLMARGINVTSDNVKVTGELRKLNAKSINFSGPVLIGSVILNDLRLDSIHWKMDIRAGKLAVQTSSSHYFEGKQNGRILIDFTKKPLLVNIQSHIAGLDIGEFREAAHLNDVFFGNLDYDVNLSFNTFNWTRALRSMNGEIKFRGKKMLLQGISVEEKILEYKHSRSFDASGLTALFTAGPFGAVLTKDIRFAPLPSEDSVVMENIGSLSADWKIKDGIAQAKDVAFSTEKYRFAVTGDIDLVQEDFNDMTIRLVNKFGCPVLGTKMNGPFAAPELETDAKVSIWAVHIDTFWKDMANSTRKNCNSIYSGSVKHPAGE